MQAEHTLKRFFADLPEPVNVFPAEITVRDEFVVHHLRTVMRAKPAERVVLVDSARERAYVGTLQHIGKHALSLTLEDALPAPNDSLPRVILAVALIKEQRWDWLLQKATELGVRAFQPLLSERTVIKLSESDIPKKQERWQSVLRSAAEQSEGLFIPEMLTPMSVSAFCNYPSADSRRILLAERGEGRQTLKSILGSPLAGQPLMMAIGPEGGWTTREMETLVQAGFKEASLGARILRSETAAIAAMAAVVYELGQ